MATQPNSRRPPSQAGRNSPRVIETTLSTEHHTIHRPLTHPGDGRKGQMSHKDLERTRIKLETPSSSSEQPKTEKPLAEQNSNYTSVDLPSGFHFYSFKSLNVRPLKAMDQAKLHQAATQKSIRHTVEAISATLEPGISAMDLTPQDFYFLMYWQRTMSFLKTPLVVTGYCSDVEHNQKVIAGFPDPDDPTKIKKLPESSLKLSVTVNKTTLKVENYVPQQKEWPLISELGLGVETMRDVVWASENLLDRVEDLDEKTWLAGYASFLKPQSSEDDLGKRMLRIMDLTPDQIEEFEDYLATVTPYGVTESTKVKCTECGASNEVVILFDAQTFLSHSKRG